MSTVVVYVHGLWMTGLEGVLLRRRLARELDAATPLFSYPSVRGGIASNAQRLANRLRSVSTDTLHLVGHSLGGVVIVKMFEEFGLSLPPGRVVLLGSPVSGSRAALGLAGWRIGKVIMGRGVREDLLSARQCNWTQDRELGVIAGTLAVGLGRLVNSHPAPSDGTVYVDETSLNGMKQRVLMRVGHTGLPFSAAVARQTAEFLRNGRFNPQFESDRVP